MQPKFKIGDKVVKTLIFGNGIAKISGTIVETPIENEFGEFVYWMKPEKGIITEANFPNNLIKKWNCKECNSIAGENDLTPFPKFVDTFFSENLYF